jgi:general secretion pathway protein F
MPAFRFEAATGTGRIERGVVDADSAKMARGVLRDRGLTPIAVSPLEDGSGKSGVNLALGSRLRDADLALATRQLVFRNLLKTRSPQGCGFFNGQSAIILL